ncbi:hypothetical protein CR513_42961, partial [Mucuna pruriens]
MVVDKQVSLAFILETYNDKILCNVVPMEFDRKVTYDGVTNRFPFVHMGQKVNLKPLSPREVNEDQLKMKIKRKKNRKN